MDSLQAQSARVAELMKERLGIRGKTLARKLGRSGRLLPKRIKQDASVLVEAAGLAQSPRLVKMIDRKRVNAAYKACVTHLEAIDVRDRRIGALLGVLGSLSMAFLVPGAALIAVLVWRGFI
jgi:hypothetical protein